MIRSPAIQPTYAPVWSSSSAAAIEPTSLRTFICIRKELASGRYVVNPFSIFGLVRAPDNPPYHTRKGAGRWMTKTDVLLYAKDGIKVDSTILRGCLVRASLSKRAVPSGR